MIGETIMKWTLNDFTKLGFANLIRPFENSVDDVVKTTRAFGIATRAHIGQFRDENKSEPYINHPLRVALILTEELHKYDVTLVCVALLHDVIEKGDQNASITEDHIRKESGDVIYSMVRALTKPKMIPGQRERLLNEHFQSIRSASEAVRYVKLSDELDNMRSLKNSSHKDKVLRYKQDAQRYIIPIAEHTDERLLFKLSIAIYELK
jgi:(p)ppGpp synthase/HD superfamily hydrolase